VLEHHGSFGKGATITFIQDPELNTSVKTGVINKGLVIETNVKVLVYRSPERSLPQIHSMMICPKFLLNTEV
jgi:ribosomal protein S8E